MVAHEDFWDRCLVTLRERTTSDVFTTLIEPLQVEQRNKKVVVRADNRWLGLRLVNGDQGTLIARVICEETGLAPEQVVFESQRSDAGSKFDSKRVESRRALRQPRANLDKSYRFENFVTGQSKRVEKSIAMSVADSFNSELATLVICGSSGYGKTHLLHAIGHHIYEHYPKKALKLAHSTSFVNEVTSILRTPNSQQQNVHSAMRSLQMEYSKHDVILVDDLHHFVGKKKIQEEFLHLLNLWQENETKLAFTSLGDLRELDNLDPALRSRLLGGVAIHAVEPDDSVKVQVLLHQAQKEDIELPQSVAEYLAAQLDGDIRVLKGTLLSIARTQAIASKRPGPVSQEAVDETLTNLNRQKRTPTVQAILSKVSEHYDVSIGDIRSGARVHNKLIPRQMGMMLAHELTTLPLTEIAAAFGRKDHSTVKNALEALPVKFVKNPQLKQDYDSLKKALR